MSDYEKRFWVTTSVIIILFLIAGSILLILRFNISQPVEISLNKTAVTVTSANAYVGGAVNNPGYYQVDGNDKLSGILEKAGVKPDADLNSLKISVDLKGKTDVPQKIDLNRAPAWLLVALPGVGTTRAQAIINYRQNQGAFMSIQELLRVPGFGQSTFEQIKDMITVGE